MDLSATERALMDRFAQKTQIAGGASKGYVLRRQALAYERGADFDLEGGLAKLVERGLLTTSESGDFVYLTEQGADSLVAGSPVAGSPAAAG